MFTHLPNLKLGIKPPLQNSKNIVLYFSRKRRSGSNDGPDQMEDLENKVRLFIDIDYNKQSYSWHVFF